MNQSEFDVIIDRFLDGAAKVRAKKFEQKNKPVSITEVPQFYDKKKTNIRAA